MNIYVLAISVYALKCTLVPNSVLFNKSAVFQAPIKLIGYYTEILTLIILISLLNSVCVEVGLSVQIVLLFKKENYHDRIAIAAQNYDKGSMVNFL